MILRGPAPLRGFDTLIVDSLVTEMKRQGMQLLTNSQPTSIEKLENGSKVITLSDGSKIGPFDEVMFAINPLIIILLYTTIYYYI